MKHPSTPILVTGGTGTLGRLVVPRLREAGRDVRVLSRRRRESGDVEYVTGDLLRNEGVESALTGSKSSCTSRAAREATISPLETS